MTTKKPRKDYFNPADFISGIAGGFMANVLYSATAKMNWEKALFSFTLYPSGRIKVEGRWAEWVKAHLDFAWLVKLVKTPPKGFVAHNSAFDLGAITGLDVDKSGNAHVQREYDYLSRFPDSSSTIDKRWGSRRLCICSHKGENAARDRFCAWCGGGLIRKPTIPDVETCTGPAIVRKLPHPMTWYCQHIKPSKPWMICLAKKGHKGKHFNGSFTWES